MSLDPGVLGRLPRTRRELFAQTGKASSLVDMDVVNISRLSADQCWATAAALNLPPLPANTLVAHHVDQIAEYMGIPP